MSGLPTVVVVALIGALTGFVAVSCGGIVLFAFAYLDAKKPDSRHRDALPEYYRAFVDVDWRAGLRAYATVTVWFLVAAVVVYVFGVGVMEVFA